MKKLNEIDFQKIKDIDENNLDKVYGTRQALLQGATFGQAPHIWGGSQALGGALYNIINKQNPFKDVAKDYTEGREEFKKEYKDFEDKNKALAFGGDLVGGLATGGLGAKAITKVPRLAAILNSSKLLQSPITRAALVGGAFGGGYGASNTLGKGFDFGSSVIGAGTGAVLGGGLGKLSSVVGNKAKQLLGGKERALLENKPVQELGNQEQRVIENIKNMPQAEIQETKLLENMKDIPKNVIDVTEQKIENSNLPQKVERNVTPLSIKERAINSLKTGYQMDGVPLITPKGMQYKNMRAFINNPKFWKAASEGSLGRKWETLQNEAADEFRKMNKEISSFVENAYKDIPDNTVIPLKFNEKNQSVLDLAQEEINKLANKRVTRNQASALKKAQELLDMAKVTVTEQDGNYGMNFRNIQDMTQQLYDYGEMFAKKDNRDAANMFRNIRKMFAEYRDTNPLAAKATERYRDFKEINKTLGEIGMDVEKVADNNNAETRIQVNSRGRAGEKMNRALDKVLNILEKYPELKQFKDLKDKVQLAQISYDARPSSNDKLLSATSVLKKIAHPIRTIDSMGDKEAQDELQVLGRRLLEKKIRPEDLKKVDMFRGGDNVNVSYYRKKAYGNIIDELKSKKANKQDIEKLYEAYQGAI